MSTALSSSFTPHNHLHEHGGAEVRVRVPPVGRAAGGAARAQDALVHAVQLLAVHLEVEGGKRGGVYERKKDNKDEEKRRHRKKKSKND